MHLDFRPPDDLSAAIVSLFMGVQGKRAQYLEAGDVVEARIRSADGAIDLGVQRNTVVVES